MLHLTARRRRWSPALAAVGVLLSGTAGQALAQSCAMCTSSFAPDDPVQRAFSWSILFLMAAPYTIVGSVAGWLFFTYRYRRAPGRRPARVLDLRRPVPAGGSGGDLP